MRPGVASKYLSQVIEQFEKYAVEHYLRDLGSPDVDDLLRLAGLRLVATRGLSGHEGIVREIFTTRFMGQIGRRIDRAALDALLATTDDPLGTARFLARVATLDKPLPTTKLAANGLERLGPAANAALLAELAEPHKPKRRVQLARLLAEASGVSSPEPIVFWRKASAAERAAGLEQWRVRLDAAGLLPPPLEDDGPEEPAQEGEWDEAVSPEPAEPE